MNSGALLRNGFARRVVAVTKLQAVQRASLAELTPCSPAGNISGSLQDSRLAISGTRTAPGQTVMGALGDCNG